MSTISPHAPRSTLTLETGRVYHTLLRNGVDIGYIRFQDEAAYLVHATTHHYALVRALRLMLLEFDAYYKGEIEPTCVIEARDTLTAADQEAP